MNKKKWQMAGIGVLVVILLVISGSMIKVFFKEKSVETSPVPTKEGISLTITNIEETEEGYWIEYSVENKVNEPISYAQDWEMECWQNNTWKQVAKATQWEECLYSAPAYGTDTQRFLLQDVTLFPDKKYRLLKKLYYLEDEEPKWILGEFQIP